jgi:hypothetical protein
MNFGTTLSIKRQGACPHSSRITIRTHGIERQICENCAHVSFAFAEEELSEIERDRFARPVDQLTATQN